MGDPHSGQKPRLTEALERYPCGWAPVKRKSAVLKNTQAPNRPPTLQESEFEVLYRSAQQALHTGRSMWVVIAMDRMDRTTDVFNLP